MGIVAMVAEDLVDPGQDLDLAARDEVALEVTLVHDPVVTPDQDQSPDQDLSRDQNLGPDPNLGPDLSQDQNPGQDQNPSRDQDLSLGPSRDQSQMLGPNLHLALTHDEMLLSFVFYTSYQ